MRLKLRSEALQTNVLRLSELPVTIIRQLSWLYCHNKSRTGVWGWLSKRFVTLFCDSPDIDRGPAISYSECCDPWPFMHLIANTKVIFFLPNQNKTHSSFSPQLISRSTFRLISSPHDWTRMHVWIFVARENITHVSTKGTSERVSTPGRHPNSSWTKSRVWLFSK